MGKAGDYEPHTCQGGGRGKLKRTQMQRLHGDWQSARGLLFNLQALGEPSERLKGKIMRGRGIPRGGRKTDSILVLKNRGRSSRQSGLGVRRDAPPATLRGNNLLPQTRRQLKKPSQGDSTMFAGWRTNFFKIGYPWESKRATVGEALVSEH